MELKRSRFSNRKIYLLLTLGFVMSFTTETYAENHSDLNQPFLESLTHPENLYRKPSSEPKPCYQYSSEVLSKKVNYCVVRSRPDIPFKSGEPVVYYFHGIMGDENRFFSDGYVASLKRIAEKENFPAITFVSFETEAMSYHINRNASSRAYENWFLGEFVPFIEKTYQVCNVRRCRGLFGNSMGGIGSLNAGFKYPEHFGVLANTAPVIVPFNIFDSLKKWDAYFERHPIWRAKGYFLITHARYAFKSRENFENHQILSIAQSAQLKLQELPQIYLDVGGQDEYGFDEGQGILKKIFDQRGIKYESDFYPGGQHEITSEPERADKALRFLARYFLFH